MEDKRQQLLVELEDKRRPLLIKRYFEPFGCSGCLQTTLILTSVVGFLIAFWFQEFGLVLASLPVLFVGAIWAYRSNKGKLSDSDIDKWLSEDVDKIARDSVSKLGLDKSLLARDAIVVRGPVLWKTNGVSEQDLKWKKGEDGAVRFAINRLTILQFTNQLLAVFTCDYNFLKGTCFNSETNEYYYQDIVSVRTGEESMPYTLPDDVQIEHSRTFRITVSSGDSILVVIGATELEKFTSGKIPTKHADEAVQVVRTMLREKKNQPYN